MTRYLADTNVLVRFLAGEPSRQATAARQLFECAARGEILIDVSPVIVSETYYTLLSFYGIERKAAASQLALLLRQHGIRLRDADQTLAALDRLLMANVGFADAFLAAGAAGEDVAVVSFDRDFDKLGIRRFDPSA